MFNNGNILGPSLLGFKTSESEDNFLVAIGGIVSTYNNIKVHILDSSQDLTVLKKGNGLIELFICGGGAGGALNLFSSFAGGGGGAGEYFYNAAQAIDLGVYPAVIGAGGIGATTLNTNGTNGGNTTFLGLTKIGGGFGGGVGFGTNPVAGTGAYGGGGAAAGGIGGTGIIAFKGGNGSSGFGGAGGGGGAGGAAPNAPNTNGGAIGGVGLSNAITGTLIQYCQGGDGGGNTTPRAGLNGVNYGDGGGGNLKDNTGKNNGNAGNGKSGVVIVAYQYKN